ncbi:MAG TPA: hypothetical protein VFP91_11985 [Vicinamibacterales bacterium]|nr:hypothetical protein [Vicinamibacterales bacterium]
METNRERTGPTDEVGSEGGTPGDLELNKTYSVMRGSETTSTVVATETDEEIRDRNRTRDDRPEP